MVPVVVHQAQPSPSSFSRLHTHSDSTSTQPQRRPRAGSLISSTNIVPCGDEGHQDVKLLGLMEGSPFLESRPMPRQSLQLWVSLPAAGHLSLNEVIHNSPQARRCRAGPG